jgi:putative hydrolase of the HAD superfamily
MVKIMYIGFDADDTLGHYEDRFHEAYDTFSDLLIDWAPADQVRQRLLDMSVANLSRYGYGAKSLMLTMTQTAIDISNAEVDASTIATIIELGHDLIDRPAELLDDVAETLTALNDDHTLMLITKGDLHAQHAKIVDSGLAERFWSIDIVPTKDQGTYEQLLRRHGVETNEFVMVGNSLPSDCLPVVAIGAKAVHVPYHVTWDHEHHDGDHTVPTIERLGELPPIIDGWS